MQRTGKEDEKDEWKSMNTILGEPGVASDYSNASLTK
jgi:hypothetical protein